MKFHKNLTIKRWRKLSTIEQMANIGAEVGRTVNWRKKDKKISQAAFWRALELFDATISDPKNKKSLKEICRARELAVDYFAGENEYHSSDKFWQDYFYAFNYAARINR